MIDETVGRRMIEEMVARFPELQAALDRHVEDVGELLPHVYLWDVVEITVRAYTGESDMDWRSFLLFLETRLAGGDRYVSELIGTSYLESLKGPTMPGHGIVLELGPLAASMFRELRPAG